MTTAGNATTGAGQADNAIVNDKWTNKTATPLTVTYAIIPRIAAGCIGDQENVVVTISPEPDLNNLNTTICSDVATGVTLSDVHGLANSFEIVSITPQAGLVTTAGNATTGAGQLSTAIVNDKWTNKTAGALTVTYAIIPRVGGGCIGDQENVVITVNPEPDLNPLSSTVCSDAATGITLSDVHGLANSYEIVSITPTGGIIPGGGNATTGTGKLANAILNDTWTNKTAINQTVTYVITPRIAAGCIGDPENVVVTVNPEPDLSNLNTTVCSDASSGVTLDDVHNLANSFEIVSITPQAGLVTTAGNATTGAGQADNAIVNDKWTNKTATPLTVTYAIIPRIAAGCIGDQENVVVTINPEPDLNNLNKTICSNIATGITLSDVHGLATLYEIVSITIQPGLTPDAGNATTGAGKLASAIFNDKFTNITAAALTVTYAVIPRVGGGCIGDQENIVVTVSPEPDLANLNTTVCNNVAINVTLADVLSLADQFDIISITPQAGLTAGGGNVVPANGMPDDYIENDVWINSTTGNLSVTYVVRPSIGGICYGVPENVVITVRPPIVPGSVVTTKTSVCYNTDAPVITNAVVASGGDGVINYQWFYTEVLAAVPGDANWTLIVGATAQDYDPGILVNPTKYIRRAKDGSCAAEVWSNMIQFNIDPLPVTSAITGATNLCIGDANKLYRVDDHVGSTYAWTVPPAISSKAFDANIYFILVNADAAGTGNIQVVETITATGCVGTPVTFPLTVSSASVGVVPTGPGAVCEGATGVVYELPFRAGSTYSWSLPPGAFITAGDGTYQVTVSFPASVSGNVTALETNGACTTAHLNLPVNVKPKPYLSSSLTPPGICSASTFNYTATSAFPSPAFAWSRAAVAGISEGATAGAGNVSETLTNTTNAPISVTYVYITTADGCTGNPQNVVVVVNPSGHVNDPSDLVLCNAAPSPAIIFTSLNSGGTTTYAWSNDTPGIGLAASGAGNIASFTAVNTGTTQVTATITVTPTFKSGLLECVGTPETFTIKVNPTGQVNDPADRTVCNTDAVAPVVFTTNNTDGATTYTWTNSASGIGLAASGTGDLPGFATVNTGTSPVVATITVTPHYANSSLTCTGPVQTFTITVNPTGQVNDPADQVACNGGLTTSVVFSTNNTGGTTTYSWVNSDATIGLAANGTGNIGSFAAINTGTSQVVATIVVTPHFTNNAITCDGPTESFTITVNPSGDVIDPADQILCNGEATAPVTFATANTDGATTYSWTNNVTGIGLAASGTGNIAAFNAVNTGTSPVTATIIVTPHYTNGGKTCDGPTESFTITVNPTGQVNTPVDRVVCNGAATPLITFTTNNSGGTTTFNWTSDNTAIGIAASGTGDIASFLAVNGGLSPVVANITVTPTFTNGISSCIGTPKVFTITVNPDGNVVAPANQVVCNGSSTAAVNFTSNNTGGTTSYTWTNTATGIGLPATGSGNLPIFTATNTGTDPVIANITVTPHFSNGSVTCTGAPEVFTITVNPTANVDDPADQIVCNGGTTTAVNFTTTNGGGVAMTYNWTNSAPGIGLAASGTGDIAAFAAVNTGTSPVVASITVTPQLLFDGKTCSGPAQIFTITVNPTANVNDPADQVVCNAGMTTAVNFATTNSGGTMVYNWTNSAPGIGLPATGSGNIASFAALNAGTAPVVATITVTPEFTNGSVTCSGPAQTFTITVNPTAQVDPVADEVVCNGDATTAVAFTTANTGGTTVYNWTNSAPGIGLAASGTGNIASFTASNITTAPVVATITVTPQFTNAGKTCSGPAETFTITVNPTAQVNSPASQVVCHDGATTAVNFTTNNTGGTTVFNWTNSAPGIGLPAIGSGDIASFTAINTGTAPVVATITVTPEFTNDGVTCTGPSKVFTITVNPLGQVNDPADQVVCNGGFTNPVTFATVNTGGTTTYTWTNSLPAIGLGASGSGNIGSFAAINGGLGPVTATITVTPHFDNGSVTCDGPVQTFTITVNPTAKVDDPANQVVCHAGSTADVIFGTTNTGGTVSYTWTNDETGIGLGASGSGDILSFPVTNTGTAPLVATIIVTPHYENLAVTCDGPVQSFTITVNPLGQVNDPADQVVCNGAPVTPVSFSTINTGGTTTYNWVNNTPSIGLAANGSGNISTFNAVNTGTAPVVATITITPVFTNGAVSCNGPTETFTITVNPTAQVDDPADQVVCNGDLTALVTFATNRTGGTTTYNWTNNATSIGLAASGSGNIAAFNAVNTGTSPVIATITVTPVFTNGAVSCSGPSESFTITVNPTAQVNDPADRVVCNGVLTTAIPFSTVNTGGTTTYTWVNDNPAIGLAAGGTGPVPAFTATNGGTAQIFATITVTPHFENATVTCDGPVQTFTISVNPTAQVNDPADQELCNGDVTAAVNFSTTRTDGTTTYSWTNNKPGIGLAAVGTGDIPSFTVSNITTAPVIATITVTPLYDNGSESCSGPVQTFTITVNPAGQVNKPADQVKCVGQNSNAVTFTTVNTIGTTDYIWTNDNTAIGLGAAGVGNIPSFVTTNVTTAPITGTITVTPTFNNGTASCVGPAQTFTITVNPLGQVNDPADQVVCNGASTANVIFSTANTGGSTSYSWVNDTPGIGLAASGTGNIPFFTAVNAGTDPVVATITVTPQFSNGSVNCTGTPETFTITVNPTANVVDPADQVVCNGSNTTAVAFTTTNGGGVSMVYNWTNSAPGIGLPATGSGNIAAFAAANAGTSPVVATITVTPQLTFGSVTCSGPAQTFTITVNPTANVNDPADQVVCNGAMTTGVFFSTTNTGGSMVYNWTNDQPGIGLAAAGSGNIGSFAAINAGTAPIVATITVTPEFTNGSVTCTGPSQTFTITVNQTAQVDAVANQVVCNTEATTAITFATTPAPGVGTMTYNWTNSATSIGLAAMGTGNIASFSAVNSGTSPVVATITVTPQYTNGGVTCSGPSKNFTITVNPTAQVNDPADLVVCNTQSTSVTFVTNRTGGTTTYDWTNTAPGIGLPATGSGDIGPFAAANTGTAPVTATIVVTPTFDNAGHTCAGPSQTFTITVNPTGQVADPADQVVCHGSYTSAVVFSTSNTGGTTTYTWTNDLPAIGLPASGTGNISAFSAVNTGTAPVVANIVVTPHFTNGLVTCDGPTQTFTITVNQKGQVNDPADQVVCNGAPVTAINFTTTATGGATTYLWTNSAPGIGLAASGTGDIATFNAVNTGTSPVVATITVTPRLTNSAVSCDGPVETFTITVNPTAQVNDPADQLVCNGANAAAINFTTTNTGGVTTYDWANDTPGIGLAAVGSGNIAAFTALNTGTTPVVATITVTPNFTNGTVTCTGPPQTFTITVNPTPNVSTASPTTICSTETTNIALTSNVAGATFTWTIAGTTGGVTGASASGGATIAQALVNPGTTAGTVTYRVTPTANSCSGTPVDIIVTVNPTPNVTYTGSTTICSATSTNISLNSNVAGATFTWTIGAITGGITGATPSGGATISQVLTNPGSTAGTVTYIVTPTANSCPGNTTNIIVTVNPTPDVTTASSLVICSATATNIALTSSVSGATFSWTIGTITGGVTGATPSNGTTIAQTLYNSGLVPGTVTYIVTPTANSCSGSPTNFVVTVNPLTGPTSFTTGSPEVCQDAPDETYTATATNSTSIVYSVSPAAAGTINPATGVMNWDAAFYGNATITATSTGLCGTTVGTMTVRVKRLPAVTVSPVDRTICEFGVVNFDVTAVGDDLAYQWYVDEGSGFIPVSGGAYSGQNSSTLQIWSAVRAMNGYKYRAEVSGCAPPATSGQAVLTVNTAPELTLHPSDTTICLGEGAVMKADADGTSIAWQWQVNKGSGFVSVTDDANFSGSATKTLTITNALTTFNNWVFRAKATGICGVPVYTNFGRLNVTNPPVPTLQPLAKEICEDASTSFIANGSGYVTLKWQVSTNGGTTWTDISDDATYVGSVTNQLSIANAPVTFNGYRYRLALIGACTTVNTNDVTLTVNANPVVSFAADTNACGGVNLVLDGNPTGGTLPYATHRWTGDVGPLSSYTVQKPTFNSLITGTYNLTYTVKDSKGCTATDDIAVIVDSPDANFTQDLENGCTPLSVSFTKDMTGLSKFWWDFGDGSPVDSVNANPVHVFTNNNPASIEYRSIKLKVRSPGGCYDEFVSTVTVYPAVNAAFTASDTIVCSGNSLTFATAPGASKYFWEYGDGVSGYSPAETTTHLYTNFTKDPLILTVKLTTTSFYNCTDTYTMKIKVMPVPLPQFNAVPPTQIYNPSGNPVSFTNQTNDGTWSYLWKFGDGATSTAKDPSHTYTALGTYKVVLIVNNANCSDSISHEVRVLPPPPVANFDSIPSGCEPLTITINNTSLNTDVPGTTYRWDFGDGSISTAKNPVYTFFDPGIYRVELTVTGPGGTSSKSQVVNSYASPRAYFEVSPTFVFVNDEKVRGFNLSQPASGLTFLWEFGDGDTSKVKEPFHKYMEPGVFDITLWAYSANGCSDKYVLSPGVTVEPAGEVRFSTVFTPNLDGPIERSDLPTGGPELDQFFFPPIREKVIDYKLQIFNRLGVLIFESRDINIPWNGYYKGQLCTQGVYVWYVEGKYANGQPFKKVGDVTLLH